MMIMQVSTSDRLFRLQVWTRQRDEDARLLDWWSVVLYRLRVHVQRVTWRSACMSGQSISSCSSTYAWLGSRVSACWTQAQYRARVQIAVATLSGNSLRQTVHTHCASVHQAEKLVATLLRVAWVTAGLAESNGSLPPGLWLTSPAGWLPRTGISSGTLRSVIEYGLPFVPLLMCSSILRENIHFNGNRYCISCRCGIDPRDGIVL